MRIEKWKMIWPAHSVAFSGLGGLSRWSQGSQFEVVSVTGGGTVNVQALTLEQPPVQLRGGGLNSSLAAGIVTTGTPITAGASINVNFLLGVASGGSYRFFINVEALP